MLRLWSQFVPNMSTDIQGHETLHHHKNPDDRAGLDKALMGENLE